MKDYFTRLFEYDHFVNQMMLTLINKANNPPKAVTLMAHLFAAQRVWLNRCIALPPPAGGIWPDWSADKLEAISKDNNTGWLDFLSGLQPADLDKPIAYKNSQGDAFESRLIDIMTQVTNHGTHHRAQIGQFLLAAGIEKLPPTDYIAYLRLKR